MGFSVDYSKAYQGGLLPEGKYEVIIKFAVEDATKTGKPYISIPLVVRNDVEQKGKNAYIWHAEWKRKEPTPADLACDSYSNANIQTISKAAGLPENKSYGSLKEWCDDLKNRPMLVNVYHDEYQGKTNLRVKSFEPTKFTKCNHVWKSKTENATAAANATDFSNVSDDELPF